MKLNRAWRHNNIWVIFNVVLASSIVLFAYYSYYNWSSLVLAAKKEQETHVRLLNNSVMSFLKTQESLLEVLGKQLIYQNGFPTRPIHDSLLDNAMETYHAFIGLGLADYDGKALVVSSNFDLEHLPNLMELAQTRVSYMEARDSDKLHTGPTYTINTLDSQALAIPVRKAIYLDDSNKAVAVMTAGVRLDKSSLFKDYNRTNQTQIIEIIRKDRYPLFTTDKSTLYTQPIEQHYYSELMKKLHGSGAVSTFNFVDPSSGSSRQVVALYNSYLDYWFVSKLDKQIIQETFYHRMMLSLAPFALYLLWIFKLTQSVANAEKKKENELMTLAHLDSLTGLGNRSLAVKKIDQAIISSAQSGHYYGILFLDIDNFKTINDTYGHEHGDILLKETSQRILHHLRKRDSLTRFGGDEFVILLPTFELDLLAAQEQIASITSRMRQGLSEAYKFEHYEYSSSVSVGVVLFNNASQTSSDLLKQADIAMYNAKRSGKNRISFFKPEMQKTISSNFELERDLRTALKEKQFELYYQPQVNEDDIVIGVEALIRWRHPLKGLVSPYHFIPLAESIGLIIPIGEWVLKTACTQLAKWQGDSTKSHLSISVNISYQQFRSNNFPKVIQKLIEKYSIPAGKLKLELTETMLIDDIEQAIQCMNEVQALGVEFALDDFGTGYSSLSYLKKLPISQLKIDKSFICELESTPNARSIIETIISLSNILGLRSVAEGVETKYQRDYLESLGCIVYQGYYYCQPLPIEEVESYIESTHFSSL
ncbi:EAL domain-containing protein [Vibrio sp. NH-UV-68]|uniref:putative bifunctional diguanylate cyclase/phosphodiesterase n=1 Tax=unclassified Vibrio TaxID=2614977 RepID=UPI0036F39045